MNIKILFLKKLFLNTLIFISALLLYDNVFEVVGYMYLVTYDNYIFRKLISILGLFILTIISISGNEIFDNFSSILILGLYLPVAVVMSKIDFNTYYLFVVITSVSCVILSGRVFLAAQNNIVLFKWNLSFDFFKKFIFLLFSLVMFYLFYLKYSNFTFDAVSTYYNAYKIRAEAEDMGVINYFYDWFPLIFFPLFYSGNSRKPGYIFIAFTLFSSFFIFQIEATKIIILQSFLILLFSILYNYKRKINFNYSPQYFFIFLFLACFISGPISYPLLDRFFYLIGLNCLFYIDYFSTHNLYFFFGTKLDLGISSYNLGLGYLIDNFYYSGGGTNQSAGFMPTAYANLGFFGLIFCSILLGFIVSWIISFRDRAPKFTALVCISLGFTLMNVDFNMLFLSYGLIFIIIIPFVINK